MIVRKWSTNGEERRHKVIRTVRWRFKCLGMNQTGVKQEFRWAKEGCSGASLVAQWLGIRLPGQGTQVRALGQEDPTYRGAARPVHHNYWAHVPQLLRPVRLEPMVRNKRSYHMRGPRAAMRGGPRSPQLDKSPRAATETQHSQK